jgi:hypothetical protein
MEGRSALISGNLSGTLRSVIPRHLEPTRDQIDSLKFSVSCKQLVSALSGTGWEDTRPFPVSVDATKHHQHGG